jgi:hypothetical protein
MNNTDRTHKENEATDVTVRMLNSHWAPWLNLASADLPATGRQSRDVHLQDGRIALHDLLLFALRDLGLILITVRARDSKQTSASSLNANHS